MRQSIRPFNDSEMNGYKLNRMVSIYVQSIDRVSMATSSSMRQIADFFQ